MLNSILRNMKHRWIQPPPPPPPNATPPEAEHFVPPAGLDVKTYIDKGDIDGAHHLIRYLWATRILAPLHRDGSVLDIACGAGYGSYLLAQALPQAQVVGADYDPQAIHFAQAHYRLPNLEYRRGDVHQWSATLGDTVYTTIVSFDTLEHCPHREIMLESLVDHLSSDGRLLFSTPSGDPETNFNPKWNAHKIEYNAASLYDFLSRYFRTIRRPEESDFPGREVFDAFKGSSLTYCLRLNPVLCTDPIKINNPYKSAP